MHVVEMEGVEYNLNVSEVGRLFGYSGAHIRRLAADGKIPSLQRGRVYLFNLDEVRQHLVKRRPAHVKAAPSATERVDNAVKSDTGAEQNITITGQNNVTVEEIDFGDADADSTVLETDAAQYLADL